MDNNTTKNSETSATEYLPCPRSYLNLDSKYKAKIRQALYHLRKADYIKCTNEDAKQGIDSCDVDVDKSALLARNNESSNSNMSFRPPSPSDCDCSKCLRYRRNFEWCREHHKKQV